MNKNYTNKEYNEYVKQKMPKSTLFKNMTMAFLFGGGICVIAQAIKEGYICLGMDEQSAGAALSITMIAIGAILTGLGLYNKIAKHAGAGTIVPITGFANAIVSPAMEFKSEGIVLGMSAKMFVVAGPIIVFGTITSILIGLAYAIFVK